MRRTVAALLRKELLIELRSWQSVPAMCLFALTTFVVFHFALNRSSVDGDEAAGILWVTLLFAAILGVNRLFVADAEEGGFDGFLLAPVDRGALLLAKALALLCYLIALELVAVPAFALLLLGPTLGGSLPQLILVLALLLALPLFVPIVIAGARASAPLLALGGGSAAARWLATLALYDLLFGLLAYALFDFLLDD